MFQHKIDEIFNNMLNVFGIVDDILVIGYDKDGADHDEAVYNMLKWCQDVNLKLNRENVISGVHQYHKEKNDNDTSPVFSNIPIGSTVPVQCEDGSVKTWCPT